MRCEYCGGNLDLGHACLSAWTATGNQVYDNLTYETLSRLMDLGTVASPPQDAVARWRERAERAEAELHRLRVQTANLEAQLNRANFELLSRMHRMSREKANGIPQEHLMALIRLCHPDLHKGSDLANETTKWLLSLRKEN